jgi:hypothetical protein
MTTFSQRTRELALSMSHGLCQCSVDCVKPVTEFHHKCSNTKVNQILFPIFLQSIFNCCPIAHSCHMEGRGPKIRTSEAAAFEEYLREIKGGKK